MFYSLASIGSWPYHNAKCIYYNFKVSPQSLTISTFYKVWNQGNLSIVTMTPAKQKQKTKPSCILLAYNGTEYACLSQKRRNVYILRKYGQKKDQIPARSIQSPIPPCLVSGSLDSQGLLWLHHSSFAACNPSSLSPLSLFCSSSPPYSSIY